MFNTPDVQKMFLRVGDTSQVTDVSLTRGTATQEMVRMTLTNLKETHDNLQNTTVAQKELLTKQTLDVRCLFTSVVPTLGETHQGSSLMPHVYNAQ